MSAYSVGSLVRCREREWVVLPSESDNLLLLRPLGGSEKEQIGIYLPITEALGIDKIEPATFPEPDINLTGDHTSGRLLRDATRLTFRSGAGPFRSLGRISVRPRPFQLVPLLMALRLDPVRLLIADDVGIGKTIEAGLIARELLDRGMPKDWQCCVHPTCVSSGKESYPRNLPWRRWWCVPALWHNLNALCPRRYQCV